MSTSSPAVLPDLPYDYAELEPVISGEIMQLHHAKHHNTYVTNYNVAMEKYLDAQVKGDVAAMVVEAPPEFVKAAIPLRYLAHSTPSIPLRGTGGGEGERAHSNAYAEMSAESYPHQNALLV